MRILILSDIHANLPAFEAVLNQTKGQWDKLWCLGDVIGYGPNPNECIELLREQDHVCLTGNHDWAALGKLDISEFNREAQRAVRWTQNELTDDNRDFLDAIPPSRIVGDYTLAHGSPRHPVWEYILDEITAEENFAHFDTSTCFVGHTHVPMLYASTNDELMSLSPTYNESVVLDAERIIVNPGSVGQPRDSDPRAAFGLLDTETRVWEFHRIDYPIKHTQDMMQAQGLPMPLVLRLEYGW